MNYDIDIDSYIGYPISKEWVRAQLKGFKGKPVTVRINSYGGDVMTALDIMQQFRDHGDVTAYIYGMTASAATILAMGAKRIVMSRYALMLIHRCSSWSEQWGQYNAEELEEIIQNLQAQKADLETIDRVICSVYADRTGHSASDVAKTMEAAAWLSAEECLDLHLVDEIIEDGEQAVITDSVRHQFAACGLPLPQTTANETNNNPLTNTSHTMDTKEPATLSKESATLSKEPATLSKEPATLSKESATLSKEPKDLNAPVDVPPTENSEDVNAAARDEQVKALTEQLTARDEQIKALTEQIAALSEQVKNLSAADGDASTEVAPETDAAPATALAMYDSIKAFI